MTSSAHDTALNGLDEIWPQFDVVDGLVRRATEIAREQHLRGLDAVHCAAAAAVAGPTTIVLARSRAPLAAWRANGLDVVDTHR